MPTFSMPGASREADEERERAQSLREGLPYKHKHFLKNKGKIKVVEDKLQDLRKELCGNEKSKDDLVEETTSLTVS